MATDIIARGMAANAKKSVTELGNKIESEKWIGTRAEWEAVDKSTIKDGTIVYITDDETVILYDKAEMEKIAAQVAADRKAAETAAQTAQAVADSLPDDYTTAVEKIAENTAEIVRVKLTDKELQRRVDALFDIGQGVTHKFETDTDTAYQKTVPTGGKLMSVKNIGGRSIVFNQNFQPRKEINNGITATADSDGTIILNGTTTASYINFRDVTPEQNKIGKYAFKLLILNNPDNISMKFGFLNRSNSTPAITSGSSTVIYNQTQHEISLGKATGISGFVVGTVFNDVKIKIQIFDLTLMFGTGNEPSTVEEFEKIFPADYYPYNAGEIISAGTEEIVEQGKNLFDKSGKENSDAYTIPMYYDGRYKGLKIPCENGNYTVSTKHKSGYTSGMSKAVYVIGTEISTDNNLTGTVIEHSTGYGYNVDKVGIISVKHGYIILSVFIGDSTTASRKSFFELCDIQVEKSSTATAYAPFHRNEYPIPEAIRTLPGYGWSAGTARNYVDYENKQNHQCVQSVDLGTLTWNIDQGIRWYTYVLPKYLTDKNAMCNKLIYSSNRELNDESKWINSGAGFFEICVADVTTSADVAAKMSGVILYYELATPIVTDISSLIPDDFLRNIEVEAGGSVTFKNSNGDSYRIPVPSEEEYIVKLSEVGGSV